MAETFVTELTFGPHLVGIGTESQTGLKRRLIQIGTAAVVATTFNPTTKNANVVLSNGNLSIQGGQFVGNNCAARASVVAAATKTRTEFTLTTAPSSTWDISNPMTFGVDDGTNDFTSGQLEPGHDSARPGVSLRVYPTGWSAWIGAAQFAGAAITFAVGEQIGMELDSVAGTAKFTHIVSGVETLLGTVTGISLASWYAWAGQFRDGVSTANFKGPWAGTLSGGFVAYGS